MAASSSSSSDPLPASSPSQVPFSPPSSILVVGSGVFGLTTALALARRDAFSHCSITVVDRSDPSQPGAFPSPDAASVDTSRIIRADYADSAYTSLGDEALVQWRKRDQPTDPGAQGRYRESGLLLVADAAPPAPDTGSAGEGVKPKLTGLDYARLSWANVLSLASKYPDLANRVRELPDPEAIREVLGTRGTSGSWGYINNSSGWGNAAAAMAWLYDQAKQTGRINFVPGTVVSLEHNTTSVTGARLADGGILSAELVVVAAGAWTGGLVDLAGQAIATGQVLGYLEITEGEQQALANMPVILNLSTGLFIIPPTDRVLKVARHATGYINPITLTTPPLPLSPNTPPPTTPITVSLPRTSLTHPSTTIPASAAADLRSALRDMLPEPPSLHTRPFIKTRLCWYSDTPDADFLIDYHPHWRGLFVATGDSGHAFKFLPVIGDKIADCIAGNCPVEFRGKWEWKVKDSVTAAAWAAAAFTEDGTRGEGARGVVLDEALGEEGQKS
ncbi:FAD dependent oxidoreductase [Dichotomopilus funicola]|uniref:FAD dependent oxidoreductase n=1 Tax=Dichotomopilus funicola TaxID=1934379 RepID=A0AAN6ZPH9_9PEZI|nr:FAD dependent oxidoreductase [Dichotomopilus funicola]